MFYHGSSYARFEGRADDHGLRLPGVVIPHMGSGDIDTRNAMAERCEFETEHLVCGTDAPSPGVRNAIQGARGEEMSAEILA